LEIPGNAGVSPFGEAPFRPWILPVQSTFPYTVAEKWLSSSPSSSFVSFVPLVVKFFVFLDWGVFVCVVYFSFKASGKVVNILFLFLRALRVLGG
jgi:hypothetical protein